MLQYAQLIFINLPRMWGILCFWPVFFVGSNLSRSQLDDVLKPSPDCDAQYELQTEDPAGDEGHRRPAEAHSEHWV